MEKFWSSKEVNIGNVKTHSMSLIKFQATPAIPTIIDLVADCGCTKLKYDPVTRILSVKYSAGNVPKQIPGNQVIDKKITVIYEDKSTDVLHIKGLKIR